MDANAEAPGNADFIGLEIPAANFVKSFAGETELLQLAWSEMPTDLEETYEAMWPATGLP
jgi:hypothetical protein